MCFARNIGKNVGKNTSKNLSNKCNQKLLDHAKKYATDSLKTASKRGTQKTAEVIGDLTWNKIVDKVTRVSKTSPKNNSETDEEEILTYIYISRTKKKN